MFLRPEVSVWTDYLDSSVVNSHRNILCYVMVLYIKYASQMLNDDVYMTMTVHVMLSLIRVVMR